MAESGMLTIKVGVVDRLTAEKITVAIEAIIESEVGSYILTSEFTDDREGSTTIV